MAEALGDDPTAAAAARFAQALGEVGRPLGPSGCAQWPSARLDGGRVRRIPPGEVAQRAFQTIACICLTIIEQYNLINTISPKPDTLCLSLSKTTSACREWLHVLILGLQAHSLNHFFVSSSLPVMTNVGFHPQYSLLPFSSLSWMSNACSYPECSLLFDDQFSHTIFTTCCLLLLPTSYHLLRTDIHSLLTFIS